MVDWRADLFRPPLPIGIVAALLAAALVGALLLYAQRHPAAGPTRRTLLILLRTAALLAIAWLLIGPSTIDREPAGPHRVPLWILADTSASMAHRDVTRPPAPDPVSRWRALRDTWLSDPSLAALCRAADVQLNRFDDQLQPVSAHQLADLEPSGPRTRLFQSLRRVIQTPAAHPPTVLLLTDGHDTQPAGQAPEPALLDRLHAWGGRIFVVPVGSPSSAPDLAVQAWADADFLFQGQSTTIRATVVQREFPRRRVHVDLLHRGRLLQTRTFTFDQSPAHSLQFRVTPPADPRQPVTIQDYKVRVRLASPQPQDAPPPAPAAEEESFTANNEQPVFLQVSRERIKVLLLEGRPYWDTRYLALALRRDPHIDLTARFTLGPDRQLHLDAPASPDAPAAPDIPANAPAAPPEIDQAALNDFDVVILGKGVDALLPDASMLVSYVRQRGGALVLARGRPYQDPANRRILAPIAPVTWGTGAVERLSLQVTPQGRRSPLLTFDDLGPADAVLTRLPGMIAATRIAGERAASVVLLRQAPADHNAPPMAAIAHQHAGAGQVMAVLTDGLWQWALLPAALDRFDSVYELFWSRAVRWLATGDQFLPGREVSLALDRLTVQPGDPVGLTVTTRFVNPDYQPVIRVTDPDDHTQTLQPQPTDPRRTRFRATFRPTRTGVYRFQLDRPAQPGQPPAPPIVAQLAAFDRSTEKLDPSAHPNVLRAIAQATGGDVLKLDEQDRLIAHLRALSAARASDVTAAYDFNRPWALVVIIGCFASEWLLRRRAGLL